MAFSDAIDPTDHTLLGLSRPPSLEDMPATLLCPSDHRAQLVIIEVTAEVGAMRVPVYGCIPCGVAYRYQECRLVPGEEGHAA